MTVEFITDDLPDDLPPEPPPRHRWWWPLVIAVLAIVVVVSAVVHDRAQRQPAPTHDLAVAPVTTRADPACRGVPDCAVRSHVPGSLTALVRAYLPAGHLHVHTVVAVNSLTLTDLLVERDITASSGSVTVLIRIERGVSGRHEIVAAPPGVGSLLLHADASGYVVRLQYLAPETVPPRVTQLRQLTRDPRLESL